MNKLQLIGSGTVSDVFAWETGRVLKLFHAGMPIEYAAHEQAILAGVGALGLPVPEAGEVVTVGDRHGLTMEAIAGVSLLELWLGDVGAFRPIFDLLATLHHQVHTCTEQLPHMLPSQREWLHNTIAEADQMPTATQQHALATLAQLPDGQTLCHGDLHPGNVLIRPNGNPVIIDWFSATYGSAEADVARTAALVAHAPLPEPLKTLLPSALRIDSAEYFTQAYVGSQPSTDLLAWQTIISAASLAESANS